MSQDQGMMLLRMLLQMAGTFLVAKNVFSDADWTAFAGAVLTIAPILWSFWVRREAGLKQSVAAIPNTLVVTNHLDGPQAPMRLAAKIAALPETQEIVATPAIANATVSEKIVAAPGNAPPT